jgi:hypothetical protein
VGIAERVEGVAVQSLERDCADGSRIVTVAAMKSYEVTETIDASPDEVWAVVEDVARYPDWDSGVRVEGRVGPGEKLKIHSEANPGRAFAVKVTELEPGRRMVWSGGMPLGLFRGVRTYQVAPEAGGTRFTMREEYTGAMLPLIWRSMPDLQPSFDRFARGLKARVEGASSA